MQYQAKKVLQKTGGDEADDEDASEDEVHGTQVQDFTAYADQAAKHIEDKPKEVRFEDDQRGKEVNEALKEKQGTSSPEKQKEGSLDKTMPIANYHKDQVVQWMTNHTTMTDKEIEIVKQDSVDGQTLLECDETILVKMGFDFDMAQQLVQAVKRDEYGCA